MNPTDRKKLGKKRATGPVKNPPPRGQEKTEPPGRRKGRPEPTQFPTLVRSLPEIALPFPGAIARLLQAENHQVAFIEFSADIHVPPHTHRAQWEIVVNGEATLRIGKSWRTFRRGDAFWIPGGIEHEGFIKKDYRAVIVFDQKDRYKLKGSG